MVKKDQEWRYNPNPPTTHPPTTTQLLNINIKVKWQEEGPEVMLCYFQTNNFQNDFQNNFKNVSWPRSHSPRVPRSHGSKIPSSSTILLPSLPHQFELDSEAALTRFFWSFKFGHMLKLISCRWGHVHIDAT